MSNLRREMRTTTSRESTESSPSKRRRFIDATKTLLDIVKESSDAFPPLKSCVGAIDAFRKHYEEIKDVEEKLGDLIPWLTKLENDVATASLDVNPEDAERRRQLTQSLEGIWKRAQALSGKGKLARFFDKTRDLNGIVKLSEELRQAILIYQLSQQQSIDNQVSQLASSFNEFLKLRENAPGVEGKIQSTLSRLDRLKVEGSAAGDKGEANRRRILFETLEGIRDHLQSISERFGAAGCQGTDRDMQIVCELSEDVRHAIIEYQLHQQKAMYDQNCVLIDAVDSLVMNNCRRAHGAAFKHGDRNRCLKGTREGVLNKIEQWTEDFELDPVFWLHGLAGTGKSTIAQTIAETLFADGRLGASFFCSRASEDRSDLRLIFPTLAFQLAQRYPEFRSSLVPLLRSNPEIVHQSLQDQMEKLLVEPLQSSDISTVVVIDALDECRDEDPDSTFLPVLGKFIPDVPGVKFFVTSRPETHIVTGFHGSLQGLADVFILHEVKRSTVDNDIRRFFEHELSKLAQRQGGKEGWPEDKHLNQLCQRAAGFFVFATATVNFLNHHLEDPWNQLDIIMESPENTLHEGESRLKSYKSLDSLYLSILHAAFRRNKDKDDDIVRSVLAAVILATNPISPPAVATLMGHDPSKVRRILESIQSLLVLSPNPHQPIRILHKSFPDFVTDPIRCTEPRFYISLDWHTELFARCLDLIGKSQEDMTSDLPSKPGDLPEIRRTHISPCRALRYACLSWHMHLVAMSYLTSEALSALLDFLEEKFAFWFAVLKALRIQYRIASIIYGVEAWLLKIQPETNLDPLWKAVSRCKSLLTTPGVYYLSVAKLPRRRNFPRRSPRHAARSTNNYAVGPFTEPQIGPGDHLARHADSLLQPHLPTVESPFRR